MQGRHRCLLDSRPADAPSRAGHRRRPSSDRLSGRRPRTAGSGRRSRRPSAGGLRAGTGQENHKENHVGQGEGDREDQGSDPGRGRPRCHDGGPAQQLAATPRPRPWPPARTSRSPAPSAARPPPRTSPPCSYLGVTRYLWYTVSNPLTGADHRHRPGHRPRRRPGRPAPRPTSTSVTPRSPGPSSFRHAARDRARAEADHAHRPAGRQPGRVQERHVHVHVHRHRVVHRHAARTRTRTPTRTRPGRSAPRRCWRPRRTRRPWAPPSP